MLKSLRWQLTLLYLIASLGLVALVGWSAYLLLDLYFRNTTDLAMEYKMATLFASNGLPLPQELARAEQAWLSNYSRLPDVSPSSTPTSPPVSANSEEDGSDSGGGKEHDQSQEQSSPMEDNRAQEEAFDANLATIFVLPLSPGTGKSLPGSQSAAVTGLVSSTAPLAVDTAAVSSALQTGYDWRTVRLQDGTRVRLLTYRASGEGQPAVFQIGRLLNDQDRVKNQFLTGLILLGAVSSLVLGLGSWGLSGRSLGPTQKAWDQQQAFVSNASHELRTPLTLIKATAEYGLRSEPGEEQAGFLQDIQQECDYMNRLVDDLLLLSRLDTHRLELSREVIRLSDLLGETKRQFEKLAQEKGVNVILDQPSGAIWGDPTRIRQVLFILLDNALRFTPTGGAIRLTTQGGVKTQQILVADNGRGIPAEHLAHVFERFYQVKAPGDENSRSNGLGLSIAKALVTAQGGDVRLESEPGVGTRVFLSFPKAY